MKRVTSCIKPFVLGSFVEPVMCVNIRYIKNVNENTLEIHSHLLAMKISKTQKEITSQIKLFSITTFLFIHSFIPLACAECDDSLPFSGASSIPICYVLSPTTLLHQLFFHSLSPHLAIYFLVYLSILLPPNSYIILFGNSIFFHSLYMFKPS